MPVFDYKCNDCGKAFEKLVVNSAEKVQCESCGSKKVEKQISGFYAAASSSQFCPSEAKCPSAGASASCAHGGGCGCPIAR